MAFSSSGGGSVKGSVLEAHLDVAWVWDEFNDQILYGFWSRNELENMAIWKN